jgi:hypothetical protein
MDLKICKKCNREKDITLYFKGGKPNVGITREYSICYHCRSDFGKLMKEKKSYKKLKAISIRSDIDKYNSSKIKMSVPIQQASLKLLRFLESKGVLFKGNRDEAVYIISGLGFEVSTKDEISKQVE